MTADVAAGPGLLTGPRRHWDCRRIAALREELGWSQEELAARSGVSVRTIRNLELGWVQNPRRSSVDRLAGALGVKGEPDHRAIGVPAEPVRWRGPQPPLSAMAGSYRDHERLMKTVRANRLTTFFGPGGVGKTRLALSIAAEIGPLFRHGVVVVELGDLPPEGHLPGSQTAAVRQRVWRQLNGDPALCGEPALSDTATASEGEANLLLVLDNAEHIPDSVTAVTRELLGTCPGIQILTTARRRLTERLGVNREIRPLPAAGTSGQTLSHDPAVELVLRHAGADSWAAADLARELPLVAELCRRLGRLPRYLEFAAERLRTIPVRLLLAQGPTKEMLWSHDHALLPHQRSLVASLRWDMGLLTEDHRRLLAEIAARPSRRFTVDDVMPADGARAVAAAAPLALLSDLLETSLIAADTRDKYRYRLAPYVAEVAAQLTLPGRAELADETLAAGF